MAISQNRPYRFQPCTQKLTVPDSFACLNEINQPYWLATFEPERPRQLWANRCAISLFGHDSLEDLLQASDFKKGRSEAVAKIHADVHERCLRGESKTGRRTLYPNDQPVMLDLEVRPVDLVFADTGEEMRAMFTCARIISEEEADLPENIRSVESARHTSTMLSLFSVDGNNLHMNHPADDYYNKVAQKEMGKETNIRTLREYLALSCWESDAEMEEVIERALALRVGDVPIMMESHKRVRSPMLPTWEFWTSLEFTPTRDPVTGAAAVLVSETCISRLKQLEAEMVAAREVRDNFFANMSHELRTPLNGIIGLTQSLLDSSAGGGQGAREGLSSRARHVLQAVLGCGRKLAGLVRDVLDHSAMRQHGFHLSPEPTELKSVVQDVCNGLTGLIRPTVTLDFSVPEDLPRVFADKERLGQVLSNLVGNAIKFTTTGRIHVSARREGGNARDASNNNAGDGERGPGGPGVVVVEVCDEGIGIPPDQLQAVMDAFYQLDMTPTRKYGGTGLGLTLAKRLVEAHGGELRLASEVDGPNRGTRCTFTLPIASELDVRSDASCSDLCDLSLPRSTGFSRTVSSVSSGGQNAEQTQRLEATVRMLQDRLAVSEQQLGKHRAYAELLEHCVRDMLGGQTRDGRETTDRPQSKDPSADASSHAADTPKQNKGRTHSQHQSSQPKPPLPTLTRAEAPTTATSHHHATAAAPPHPATPAPSRATIPTLEIAALSHSSLSSGCKHARNTSEHASNSKEHARNTKEHASNTTHGTKHTSRHDSQKSPDASSPHPDPLSRSHRSTPAGFQRGGGDDDRGRIAGRR